LSTGEILDKFRANARQALPGAAVAKLEQAFNPTQERSGILLALPNYYFQTARFVHYGTRWPVEGAVRNRRKAVLKIWMAFDVVELINVSQMTISGGQVDVEIPQYADPRVVVPDPGY